MLVYLLFSCLEGRGKYYGTFHLKHNYTFVFIKTNSQGFAKLPLFVILNDIMTHSIVRKMIVIISF